MTKKEVLYEFKTYILPNIVSTYEKNGRVDSCARSQGWNDYTDSLCKDRKITLKQYESWTNPF